MNTNDSLKNMNAHDINSAQVTHYQQPVDDEIDLLEYWDLLWSNKGLIVFLTSLVTACAIAIALQMTPIYKAEVLLVPAGAKQSGGMSLGGLGGLASLVGISGASSGGVSEILAVLSSRAFLGDFIEKESLLPILFSGQWDAENKQWLSDGGNPPSMWKAYKAFKGKLSTSVAKNSGMVTISISLHNPELSAAWANQLVVNLNEHLRQHAIKEANKSMEYLNRQIAQTSVLEMQQMLYSLIEEETKKIMLANVRTEYAFKVIDPAVTPEDKIKPKRAQIAMLGFIIGFFIAIFFVFFRSFVRKVKKERGTSDTE